MRRTKVARILAMMGFCWRVFARDVERQVVAVNHSAHKAQPQRQKLLAVVLDKDPRNVQVERDCRLRVQPLDRCALGNVEYGVELDRHIHDDVLGRERLVGVAGQVRVKLVVLLGGNFVARPGPQRGRVVDLFAGYLDGVRDKIRVLADDGL